jgi:hypothetical protein
MNKTVMVLDAAAALMPVLAHAREINAQPGFYIGADGGITTPISSPNNTTGIGWVIGGKVGYDFVGPRVDVDVGYGQVPVNFNIPGTALNGKAGQLTALANLSYDFLPTSVITPYVGAGAVPTRSRTPWCATACRRRPSRDRQGRDPAAGPDRRRRARAAEPPRRDRSPVASRSCNERERRPIGRLFLSRSLQFFRDRMSREEERPPSS